METKTNGSSKAFIDWLCRYLGNPPKQKDTGLIARMKRADNPDTDFQVWDTLVKFNVDIERQENRLPYCIVGAALCRENVGRDGLLGLGGALRICCISNGDISQDALQQGSLRLRRLISCTNTLEVCRVLRPVLSLISSKAPGRLCYAGLLNDLLFFDSSSGDRIKARWAKDYWAIPSMGQEEKG